MRSALIILSLLALTGCGGPKQKLAEAKERLALLKRTGASSEELCRQEQNVYAAAVDTGQELTIQMARVEKDLQCNQATLDRLQQ